MNSVEDAIKLIERSILIKEIIQLIAMDQNMDALIQTVKETASIEMLTEWKLKSFKFLVNSFGKSVEMQEQLEIINRFAFLSLQGDVNFKNPEITFSILLDYGLNSPKETPDLRRVFFGLLIAEANRKIVKRYDLKKRNYLGTTSMDAELSLIMANQALAQPDSLIIDPFVGTGSFLVSCSHFGAYTMGSDIDGRQIKGKPGETEGILSNLKQYNLEKRVLGNIVCDFSKINVYYSYNCSSSSMEKCRDV